MEESLKMHRSQSGICYSDESNAYNHMQTHQLYHASVCHSQKEWARDDDGDGINEVHTNTIEGLWTELRNFLRPFKGVSKHYIHLYIAMFEWMFNLKTVNQKLIQVMVLST